jgi:TonB family protein
MIFLGVLNCHSQELKKITKKSKKPYFIEEYHVLQSNKSIKHGEYLKKTLNGNLRVKGYFTQNRKDSTWIYFDFNGIDTVSIRKYKNDLQTGQWTIFSSEGDIRYIYDYVNNDIIEYNWGDTTVTYLILQNNEWVDSEVDNPPLIIGNENPLQIVSRNLNYPIRAMENGISGQVWVYFTIDIEGKMTDVKVKDTVNEYLDAEAIRAVKTIDEIWFPAKKNGEAITIEYKMPINFVLQ